MFTTILWYFYFSLYTAKRVIFDKLCCLDHRTESSLWHSCSARNRSTFTACRLYKRQNEWNQLIYKVLYCIGMLIEFEFSEPQTVPLCGMVYLIFDACLLWTVSRNRYCKPTRTIRVLFQSMWILDLPASKRPYSLAIIKIFGDYYNILKRFERVHL